MNLKRNSAIITLIVLVILTACPFVSVDAGTNTVWKNGGTSLSPDEIIGYSQTEGGFTKLSVTDVRGCVKTPNLDEAPYYLSLGMDGSMPCGSEADGGRWAQLHISSDERNPNWNPEHEIYIEFPNEGANPRSLTVKNTVNGPAQTNGVLFESQKIYTFCFAKEQGKLVIYCDGVRVFEGQEELQVFSGEKLWFITLGNLGENDTFKDYPLLINPFCEPPKEESDPIWKNAGMSLLPDETIGYSETADGFTKLSVTDVRGCIKTPNLDEAPYYLNLGMDGSMPCGSEADGGRWAQLHISSGERNPNWNPEHEIYIEFPNEGANPRSLTVKNTINGPAQTNGVLFESQKIYTFCFAKEQGKLVIYCDGVRVFEGQEELQVFSGEKLWFITLGNLGENDTFKDYPLLINPFCEPPKEESDPVWKNAGMSLSTDITAGYSEMENGFVKLSVTDVRGCIKTPKLDEAPYYLSLGMDGMMPGGSQVDGGRWAQLHISSGERNPNWNPKNEIYINFPNGDYLSKNITVKNSIDGEAQTEGIPFVSKKTYLFKFAKENNKLVIYCDDTKIFEGEEELQVFSGENLWFITLGNVGKYDTYKDYPLFINLMSDKKVIPPFGNIGYPVDTDVIQTEKPTKGWKNGGMSMTPDKAIGYSEMEKGLVKISATDVRGAIPSPDLNVSPYYFTVGLDNILPAGIQAEGGRWAQLRLSNGERNINWNPMHDIYIAFPNSSANPKNITIKNSIDGTAELNGVPFAPQTMYLFKLCKEKDKLVIYCNGEKVFEGKEELSLFNGTNLWFETLGNIGEYDTYKDFPLYINTSPSFLKEPSSYYYIGPKWGNDGNSPARKIAFDYLPDGSTRIKFISGYSIEGELGDIGQSVTTNFLNPNKKFQIILTQEVFNQDTWQVIGFRGGDELGSPLDEPKVLCVEITNGPCYQIYYRKPDGSRIQITDAIQFELNKELKLNFELSEENNSEIVKFYADNTFIGSADDTNLIALMKSERIKAICVGHTMYENPNQLVLNVNNCPNEFEVIVPDIPDSREPDPYVNLVLMSKSNKVSVDGYLLTVKGKMTSKELTDALFSPDGCKVYVMDSNENLLEKNAAVKSTDSVIMLLDDQYETFVRNYNILVIDETVSSVNIKPTKLWIWPIAIFILITFILAVLIILRKNKKGNKEQSSISFK